MYKLILSSFFIVLSISAFANIGDTIHVYPFIKKKIYTDPSAGFKEFSDFGIFPKTDKKFRKINFKITFQCPDNLHCGEWDYAGSIRIKKVNGKTEDIEIARMMTPYGWYFDGKWQYTWISEITEFSTFLHDTVEVSYIHSGYENKDDRGWLVSMDFEMIEGEPIFQVLETKKMWNGHFPYGDSLNTIENYLPVISNENNLNADFGLLKILQSGHGMDSKENCAEFCPKERTLKLNNSILDKRKIWKKCGDNPLYPQAGTWIYDRANWCPGSLVETENFKFPLQKNQSFILDFDMEKYIHNKDDKAEYDISSYLFLLKDLRKKNDISLEKIIQPSTEDRFSRYNPICSQPKILVKNNGINDINSFEVEYYSSSEQRFYKYKWKGNLKPNRTTTVNLPLSKNLENKKGVFFVKLSKPNRKKDSYSFDNEQKSIIEPTETLPLNFVVEILTNDSSKYLAYQMRDWQNQKIKERKLGSLSPKTIYRDTFQLNESCYNFNFIDTLNVGLDFWAMPEAGYGYIRFYDMNGNLLKAFDSDFGSFINLQFTSTSKFKLNIENIEYPLAFIFPRWNKGKFDLDFVNSAQSPVNFQIIKTENQEVVFEKNIDQLKSGLIPFDIPNLTPGRYTMIIKNGEKITKRGFRVTE